MDCSLNLLDIYNRMCQEDASHVGGKTTALKGRLAEAVRDEATRRELRRLNIESPALGFFDMRDQAITWLGTTAQSNQQTAKKTAAMQETSAESEVLQLLKLQSEQLAAQQRQINTLLEKAKERPNDKQKGQWRNKPRTCFRCGSEDHIVKDCPVPKPKPQTATATTATTPATGAATAVQGAGF